VGHRLAGPGQGPRRPARRRGSRHRSLSLAARKALPAQPGRPAVGT
jgi:hypothetical protein